MIGYELVISVAVSAENPKGCPAVSSISACEKGEHLHIRSLRYQLHCRPSDLVRRVNTCISGVSVISYTAAL